MPVQVQRRRGSREQNLAYTGPGGEITVDTDEWSARVHTGELPGGVLLATQHQGIDIASDATLDLDHPDHFGDLHDVTGSATITGILIAPGKSKTLRFTGGAVLQHGSSLVLPGSAPITTQAGDFATFRGYPGDVVRCVGYTRASGLSLSGGGDMLTPEMFGAVGNGVADDTAAWQALAAASDAAGGAVIRCGRSGRAYYLTGGIEFRRKIDMDLSGARFIVGNAFPSSSAVIRLYPQLSQDFVGWRLAGFAVDVETDGNGGNAIELDTSAHAYVSLSRLVVERIRVGRPITISSEQTVGGFAIVHVPHVSDPNGLFTSSFRDLYLLGTLGGAYLPLFGDSNSLDRIWTKGKGRGLHIEFTAGAAACAIRDFNSTCSGGALYLKTGFRCEIRNVTCEILQPWAASTTIENATTDRAQIVLDDCKHTTIGQSNINTDLFDSDGADCIRIKSSSAGATTNTVIEDCRLTADGGGGFKHLVSVNGSETNTSIRGRMFYESPVSTPVSVPTITVSAGAALPMGVWHQATLENSWAAQSTSGVLYEGLFFKRTEDGKIHFRGNLAGGTNTNGTVIATLPAGFRPSRTMRVPILYSDSGFKAWNLNLASTGAITVGPVAIPAVTAVSLDGSSVDISS